MSPSSMAPIFNVMPLIKGRHDHHAYADFEIANELSENYTRGTRITIMPNSTSFLLPTLFMVTLHTGADGAGK